MRERGGEAGVTLVEVIVGVAILGIAIVAIVGAMGTSILASDVHRRYADADIALRDYAETLNAASYITCGSATAYETAAALSYTPPTNYAASVTTVEYYRASTGTFGSLPSSCPATDEGLQRLSLRVASSDGRAAETVQIVKRAS